MRKMIRLLLVLAVLAAAVYWAGTDWIRSVYRSISYSWTDHTDAEETVRAYAEAMGISYGAYPESIVSLLERNPETESFVLNYPFREELETDMREYDLSEGVPLLMQWDPRWGYIEYGSDVAGLTGCGPVCLAMAGYYVTEDEKFAPDKMLEFAAENGYYSPGNGSSWTLISEGGKKLGLDVTEIPLDEKRIMDNLEVDNPIICAMGPGDFTSSGHYIVLVGCEDGKIRVNDPNSYENSGKLWTYEEIKGQIRNLWVIR